MSFFDTVRKFVTGLIAHDAADTAANRPVKIGGYASSSAPTSVTNGDVANLWVTQAGALNVADGGGSLTVDGTVTVQDGGGSLTVDGTVAVTNSDLTAIATGIGTPTDAASGGTSNGSVIAKLKGLIEALGTLADAEGSSGAGASLISRIGGLFLSFGVSSDAAATAGSTGTLQAKARFLTSITNTISTTTSAISTAIGAIADASSATGSIHAKTRYLAETTQQYILPALAAKQFTGVYTSTERVDIAFDPVNSINLALHYNTSDSLEGAAEIDTSNLNHPAWDGTVRYIWMPTLYFNRIAFMVKNTFNQSLALEIAGVLFEDTATAAPDYQEVVLDTVTLASNAQVFFGGGSGGAGVSAEYRNVPAISAGWTHLRLKFTPAGDPSSGNLIILTSRTY